MATNEQENQETGTPSADSAATPPKRPPTNASPQAESEVIRPLIEQLYGSEGLTGALTDDNAGDLLAWGEQQLRGLSGFQPAQAEAERFAMQLRRVIRFVNRSVEQQADMSQADLVKHLLRLVEQAMELANQKSNIERGIIDDQKT